MPMLHPSSERRLDPLDSITIAGQTFPTAALPPVLKHRPDLGVVTALPLEGESLHLDEFICHPRSIIAPNGDYLLFYAAGPSHYGWAKKDRKGNTMYVRRSTDRGRTWSEPTPAWEVPYSQHAVIPLIPRGTSTIYAFGTEPRHDVYDGEENAAIGFRTSEDNGYTWSEVTLIHPQNAPDYQGMSAMRMCETESGVWILGTHAGHWNNGTVICRSYALRSDDRGATWTLHPGPGWDDGWRTGTADRMDEPRPISLGGEKAMILVRTCEGQLWEIRTDDAGKTWTAPKPTALLHPDAPPMIFHLADGKTLAAFFHNRFAPGHFSHEQRTELWLTLSEDNGLTWTEPRFVLANAAERTMMNGWMSGTPMVSYADLLVDGDDLHLFVDHQMRQVLHFQFKESDIEGLPTRADFTSE